MTLIIPLKEMARGGYFFLNVEPPVSILTHLMPQKKILDYFMEENFMLRDLLVDAKEKNSSQILPKIFMQQQKFVLCWKKSQFLFACQILFKYFRYLKLQRHSKFSD